MTTSVDDECSICNSSQRAKERFAVTKVAENTLKTARRDQNHQQWIDEHTTNGTLAEIEEDFEQHDSPQQ